MAANRKRRRAIDGGEKLRRVWTDFRREALMATNELDDRRDDWLLIEGGKRERERRTEKFFIEMGGNAGNAVGD